MEMMLFVIALLAAAVAGQASQTEAQDLKSWEDKMFQLINVERQARGLRPFVHLPDLAEVARKHSRVMLELGEFSHEAGGSVFEKRIKQAVTNACRFGENITKNYTIEYALTDLMASPGHRGNLLDPDYTAVGIGIAKGEQGLLYITQDFISPCKKGSGGTKEERFIRY